MFKRKILFVDKQVQGMLLRHVFMYGICCVLFVTVPLLIGAAIANPDRNLAYNLGALWAKHAGILVGLAILIPFIVYDTLKLSNRFAGPLFRLRREMRRLSEGQTVRPVHFREGDFWHDMAECFNIIAERMGQLETRNPTNTSSPNPVRELDRVLDEIERCEVSEGREATHHQPAEATTA